MADLSRHHPGRALLDSKNSPLAKAVQSLDVARLREILDLGQDANTRIGSKTALYALCSTRLSVESVSEPPLDGPGEESQLYCKPRGDPIRAGANRLDDFHRTQQRAACVAALLDAGADPNLRPWGSDGTPLISAALQCALLPPQMVFPHLPQGRRFLSRESHFGELFLLQESARRRRYQSVRKGASQAPRRHARPKIPAAPGRRAPTS